MKYKFEDIAINSTAKKLPEPSDNEHYIGLEHLDSSNLYVTRWGAETAPIGEKLLMKKGDVLFGKRRAYQKKVGIAPFDGIFSAHGMVLRPKEDVICKSFFPFFISSDYFLNEAIRISVGGLSPTINWKDLRVLEFELPSLEEQRVLADKLWAAYEVKESYKNLLAQTDKLLHAQFQKMFGAETNTPHEKLEKLCKTFIDGDWIESKDQSAEGVRLVQTGNVGNGEYLDKLDKAHHITESTFERLHCTEIFAGDILISRLPDPIGRACIIPKGLGKAITAVDCTIIRLKENRILPKYFIAATNSTAYQDKVRSFITGTTRARISRGNLATIEIPVPPIEQQNKFATVAEQAEQTKASLNKGIEAIEAVIRSLIAEGITKA